MDEIVEFETDPAEEVATNYIQTRLALVKQY